MYYYITGRIFNKNRNIIKSSESTIPNLQEISQEEAINLLQQYEEEEFIKEKEKMNKLNSTSLIALLEVLVAKNIKISDEEYIKISSLLQSLVTE